MAAAVVGPSASPLSNSSSNSGGSSGGGAGTSSTTALAREMRCLFANESGVFQKAQLRSAAALAAGAVQEKHIFRSAAAADGAETVGIVGTDDKPAASSSSGCSPGQQQGQQHRPGSATPTRIALSKLVEYPGDPLRLAELLEDTAVDLAGKDMYGLAAIHKFCSWDKVDLLAALLGQLDAAAVNALGGARGREQSCLHLCVDSGAVRALRLLLADMRVDQLQADCSEMDFRQYAACAGAEAEAVVRAAEAELGASAGAAGAAGEVTKVEP